MDSVGVQFNDAIVLTDTRNMAGRLTVFSLFCLDTFHSSSWVEQRIHDKPQMILSYRLIYLAWVYACVSIINPLRSRHNKSLASVDNFNNPLALASTFLLNLSALEVDFSVY